MRMRIHTSLCAATLALGCVFLAPLATAQPEPTGTPPSAEGWKAVTVAEGISHPWGMAWLPDGRALITARHGALYILERESLREIPMEGLPELFHQGQGGLFDISLHPGDGEDPRVYMTLSTGTQGANRTILVRGRFDGERVIGIQTLFQVEPTKTGAQHFGSRILWLPDNTMLMSVGDGGNPPLRVGGMLSRDQAQHLGSHLGSVLRLAEDGTAAPGNPFANREEARPELWSYGHRNIQGMARDPESGRIWANEHGPKGGDELNLLQEGENFGWPLATLGRDYRTGEEIGQDSVEGAIDPKVVWIPAHAPSGLAFYTGERFPDWQGSLFSGGLITEDVQRIELDGENVVRIERLHIGERVRDVRQGPDGYLYVLTDEGNGRVIRIEPE